MVPDNALPPGLGVPSGPSDPGPVDNVPLLPLDLNPGAPVQSELDLPAPPPEPPRLTPKEQLARFEKAAAGKPASIFLRRNRLILKLRAEGFTIAEVVDTADAKRGEVEWALRIARSGAFDRLVERHPPGVKGKRKEILAMLRQSVPPAEIQRQFGCHRTSVLRAVHQLKKLHTAA